MGVVKAREVKKSLAKGSFINQEDVLNILKLNTLPKAIPVNIAKMA